MSYVLAFNPTDGPVVIDSNGRTLGGQEWGAVDSTDDLAKAAVAGNRLVLPSPPGKGASPDATAAHSQAQRLQQRHTAFTAVDKTHLHELAVEAGLHGQDDDPSKTQLVADLTRSDVDLPVASPVPSKE